MAEDEKSTNQILQALDALSHTLYQARANRRNNSLALPRSAGDGKDASGVDAVEAEARPLSRRLSLMSPFRSRSKLDKNEDNDNEEEDDDAAPLKSQGFAAVTPEAAMADGEKKGIWRWGPIRALSHIGMHRVGCLFSVEVVAAQGLLPSMNGLRLAVALRKKETRDGAVQTMPARVQQGAADFDETLYVQCHLYRSGGGTTGKPLRFEPRPFVLSVVAVDAPELDFGRSAVDLSLFAKEFTDKCQQAGECVRQWDMAFPLAGKAKGGELVIKLGFQSIDDGGAGLYTQAAGADKTSSSSSLSSFARKISRSSFSVMLSPKMTRTVSSLTPKMGVSSPDLKGIDNFKLDEPTPVAEVKETPVAEVTETPVAVVKETPVAEVKEEQPKEPEHEPQEAQADDDSEIPEFDVVDKGVEGQEVKNEEKEETESHTGGLTELEAITSQTKSLELTMLGDVSDAAAKSVEQLEDEAAGPDANEEEVTGESLQVLEQGEDKNATAKSPPGRIGWRTIAILVTPIAVLVSKALVTTR
ncbi:protein PLASTID MOVEMENT IMPAIRED 1-like [Phragmites australis]|uniref:protein PLASTID MOVEMENT IMPAIRED 1-like n=1 Tax=Phragmites australis TaxID=29695 RepID=UPI002D77C463|nr:protein PLASTID MOVEMENT IMPAIRED 1-like [Phragmites australis]